MRSFAKTHKRCARLGYVTAGFALLLAQLPQTLLAQTTTAKSNDVTTPLHLMKPAYVTPYGETKQADVKAVLDKVYHYLDTTTPYQLIDQTGKEPITDLSKANSNSIFMPGDFRLLSYEWGVTYTGMLEAGAATGDAKYTDYTMKRVEFIGNAVAAYKNYLKTSPGAKTPVNSILNPQALDDCGSITASFIKAERAGASKTLLRPVIDNAINFILTKQFRLTDGTLARNRPQPNTLWLDDLYMSLPAIVQMGALTGDKKYFDEAVKQYSLFSKRMFNNERGLYMHGWVQDMDPHPQFHWARANGWAILTKIELLDALPANHPGRATILAMLKKHAAGLAQRQDGTGFWHQLLDRNDSYLETSATAIYAYCFARAVNKGWLDAKAYGPAALLAWNAVSTKVNAGGQVEGTCVGTGMGFDPAFYYYRPVNNYAAHGYGPVLLAGAEIYRMLQNHPFVINDSSVQINK
ncbi:glycoside hydrolase family 88 protein [Mucilaginibacter sp. HMF5004]|uniref:glycoside hydrolase family 88/105 protein n=1 Tax=Mucilaginibacter rivuli TaxID=2857527 RepID=UPI001C5E6670|nr:glycoside hydrolase family 88 protein [Mucilaginibacter rivuli]MBW4888673.1 glycoside hydrolase family 88 protein [Mucilaginibacter rivuli]